MVTALEQYKIIILCFSKVVPACFLCLLNYNQADTKSLRAQLRKNKTCFFFYLGFLSRAFTIRGAAGEGEGIYLAPLYHFHPLCGCLGIGRAIAAGGSPLRIAGNWTRARNLWFPSASRQPLSYAPPTTKLHNKYLNNDQSS